MKRIALAILFIIGVGISVFAGIKILRNRIVIRNQAADSCPVGQLKNVKCKFTVRSNAPFSYKVRVTSENTSADSNIAPFTVELPEEQYKPIGDISEIIREVSIPYLGRYKCFVEVKTTGVCPGEDKRDTSKECGPPDDAPTETPSPSPTPASPTPSPSLSPTPGGPGTDSKCKDCSKLNVSLNYNDPGRPRPTLTPPNVDERDLKIGRLKLNWTIAACSNGAAGCDDVEKIEFRAFNNDSCTGPTVGPTPPDQEGRYGNGISCIEASQDPGALFRLHQANAATCRCYQVNVQFKFDPNDPNAPRYCPNLPKENICCATECKPPEIIDDLNDPNDACPGDPADPYARPKGPNDPRCYFIPVNSCPRIHQKSLFNTWVNTGNNNSIEFDDDFEKSDKSVPRGDEQQVDYQYNDGGSYDVKLTCEGGYSCKKRIRVACGGPTPGNGGGNPPPGPGCPLPKVTGTCIDQRQ